MATEASSRSQPDAALGSLGAHARAADVLRAFGLALAADPIPDGKIHRVNHCADDRSDGAGWYVYHSEPALRLAFGCWRCHPEARHWTDPEHRASRSDASEIRRANARRARDIERDRREVAERTRSWLAQRQPAATSHPYLHF